MAGARTYGQGQGASSFSVDQEKCRNREDNLYGTISQGRV